MRHLLDYAYSFVGTPYRWGGNYPMEGMDCSGYVCELLKSAGVLKNKDDLSAQDLFNFLEKHRTVGIAAKPGSIAFYGKDVTRISHVTFCVDAYRCLGANGGDSSTRTLDDAARQGAFVKLRPIRYRSDLVAIVHPDYSGIGLI